MNDTPVSPRGKRTNQLERHGRDVFIVLALFIIALGLLGLIAKDRDFSENENRSLAQRPSITVSGLLSGSFFDEYSDYLTDQFWGRDRWIALDTSFTRSLGRHDVNGVYLGSDGYLFGTPETPDEALMTAKLAAVNGFAARNDSLNIMFMLVPGSSSVLTDKLPKSAPLRDQTADVRKIEAGLSDTISVIDAASALAAHADEDIFYRTDHHWTSLGAYYAFAAGADVLSPGIQIPAYEMLPVTRSFEGTLASRSGVHRTRDTVTVFLPQDSGVEYYVNYLDSRQRVTSMYKAAALEEKDKYTVFFGGNHPLVEIWTTANSGRNLLVFKDSYANSFMQFLPPCYNTIVMIDPRYYYDDLEPVMAAYGITDVLFLYSADTWMTDTSLADVLATG